MSTHPCPGTAIANDCQRELDRQDARQLAAESAYRDLLHGMSYAPLDEVFTERMTRDRAEILRCAILGDGPDVREDAQDVLHEMCWEYALELAQKEAT